MLMTLGIMIVFFVGGGAFFAGGLEAKRKPPYPWRRLDMAWQLGLGGAALFIATLILLSILVRVFRALFG